MFANDERGNTQSSEQRSDVGHLNRTTCCPYKFQTFKQFVHSIVVIIDVLLVSCTEACGIAFSGRSVWWSMGSLKLQLLSSGTDLGAKRSRN